MKRFFELIGLLIDHEVYQQSLQATKPLWIEGMTLQHRMDIIWALQKHMRLDVFKTYSALMATAKESIVGCVD